MSVRGKSMSDPKLTQLLVLGCGKLAWGRPISSLIAGSQWDTGRFDERIGFDPEPAKFFRAKARSATDN